MPELPEVETVCRGLRPVLEGRLLRRVEQRRPDLRFPLPERFVERLTGQRLTRIERRAKFILAHLGGGETLICHLGMSGRMLLVDDPAQPAEKHDHVVLETEEGRQVRFNDARRFGFMDLWPTEGLAQHPMLAPLGPEPLSNAFNGPALAAALAGRASPIKAALLDQRVVAGLGNIYVSEALFQAGLSPAGGGGARRAHARDRGRRQLAARLRPGLRGAGLLPARLGGLRPRGAGLPGLRLRAGADRRDPPPRAGEPFDFLLSPPPALGYLWAS
jgi:formamidopyrimidine-DNA glycosylase